MKKMFNFFFPADINSCMTMIFIKVWKKIYASVICHIKICHEVKVYLYHCNMYKKIDCDDENNTCYDFQAL